MRTPLVDRFWPKVERRELDECWPWLAYVDGWGYGKVNVGEAMRPAHRVAYELTVGPIPRGLTIDHLCHNRATDCAGGNACAHRRCVNPQHLEPVTPWENTLRGKRSCVARHAQATHCPQGHPYSPENTSVRQSGHRRCKECHRNAEFLRRRGVVR